MVRNAKYTFLLTMSWLIEVSKPLTMLSPLEIPDLFSIMSQGWVGPRRIVVKDWTLPLMS